MIPSNSIRAGFVLAILTASAKATSRYEPRPYTIDVDPAFIEATRLKASTFRPSVEIDAPAWFDGPPQDKITAFAEYWTHDYDWFAYQDEVNAKFDHYYTTVPAPANYSSDLDLHFIHQRSEREDAIPIILLHGWPSTSLEWEWVIEGLANPDSSSQPAFHVVAPDLPGFGWSPAAPTPGLGPSGYGSAMNSLMSQLGYEEYALYSTDLGFIVALSMLEDYEANIINHITDFYIATPNTTDLARLAANQTTAEETAFIIALNYFFTNLNAYSNIHSTLPLSIANALNDSPIGFLSWTFQLISTAADYVYSPSELINVILTLYIPGVNGNIRAYKEIYPAFQKGFAPSRVPTSVLQTGISDVALLPYPVLKDFNYVPRDWVERTANVTYFKRRNTGGHFPAFAQPENWLEDLREIFDGQGGATNEATDL